MIILVGSVFIKIRSLWRKEMGEILAEVNMNLYLPKQLGLLFNNNERINGSG